MKINAQYKVREMAGEHVIVLPGRFGEDMTRVIALNGSSMVLWEALLGKDFSAEDAAQVLLDNYEIDPQTASKDAKAWCDKLLENGIIE